MFFNNDRLQKIVATGPNGNGEKVYYYSSGNFLDSIVEKENNKVFKKSSYINNEFGDPVEYAILEDNVLTDYGKINYKYDEHRNWIRRLEHRKPELFTNERFPGYSITVREISY